MLVHPESAKCFIAGYSAVLLEILRNTNVRTTSNLIGDLAKARGHLKSRPAVIEDAFRTLHDRGHALQPRVVAAIRSVLAQVAGAEQTPLRVHLLQGVLRFTKVAAEVPGVSRIALVGSLARPKPLPKDADVLVTVDHEASLDRLAKAGRALKGHAQTRNSGADIFLAKPDGQYSGRICHWRDCRPGIRVACQALHCGGREFLSDDLHRVNLPPSLIAAPPVELWTLVLRRAQVPADVEGILFGPWEAHRRNRPEPGAGTPL